MASVFGISGLRSRLDSWWNVRKSAEGEMLDGEGSQPPKFTLVADTGSSADLSLVLENLVIPQLIAANAAHPGYIMPASDLDELVAPHRCAIGKDDVAAFARLSVASDTREMLDFIDARMANGSSVETIFVDLLAPAARRLGTEWEDDSGDFVDVTMGLWRIQEILREMSFRAPPQVTGRFGSRRALFSTMPGEQHSLGTLMVAECFQRAGWDTDVLIEPTQSELIGKAVESSFDLIGLTVSCDCPSAALANLVKAIRAVSFNPHVRLFLGGRAINEQPDLVQECGADATAVDGPSAVALADRLVPAKADCFERLL